MRIDNLSTLKKVELRPIAIKGDSERYTEILNLFENMGIKNPYGYKCNGNNYCYYVNEYNHISRGPYLPFSGKFKIFTIDEFKSKNLYKIGDLLYCNILNMAVEVVGYKWNGHDVLYELKNNNNAVFTGSGNGLTLLDSVFKDIVRNNININESYPDRIEITIPENYEIKQENGKAVIVRKKLTLPKTYEDCCEILGIENITFNITGLTKEENAVEHLIKLIRCRDAYWKLADNWEPEFSSINNKDDKFSILSFNNELYKMGTCHRNAIFSFPTEEMRDTFFENFENELCLIKHLI